MHTEKNLGEDIRFSGKVFTVLERKVQLENGNIGNRELVQHRGGSAILPIDDEGYIYLVRQFRAPFEKEILEIPAGKLEIGEEPFSTAKRELTEETGFTAREYLSLGQVYPTVGYSDEVIHLYLAKGLTSGETQLDSDEFLTPVKIHLDKACEMCLSGEIKDSKTVIAILKAKLLQDKI